VLWWPARRGDGGANAALAAAARRCTRARCAGGVPVVAILAAALVGAAATCALIGALGRPHVAALALRTLNSQYLFRHDDNMLLPGATDASETAMGIEIRNENSDEDDIESTETNRNPQQTPSSSTRIVRQLLRPHRDHVKTASAVLYTGRGVVDSVTRYFDAQSDRFEPHDIFMWEWGGGAGELLPPAYAHEPHVGRSVTDRGGRPPHGVRRGYVVAPSVFNHIGVLSSRGDNPFMHCGQQVFDWDTPHAVKPGRANDTAYFPVTSMRRNYAE